MQLGEPAGPGAGPRPRLLLELHESRRESNAQLLRGMEETGMLESERAWQERFRYRNSPTRSALLGSLAPRLRQLLAAALLLYICLEACNVFFGTFHPSTNSVRILTSLAVMLLATPIWLSADGRIVRMLCMRARPVYFVLTVVLGDIILYNLMSWSRLCENGCQWFSISSQVLFRGAVAVVFIAVPFVDSMNVSPRLVCFSGLCGGVARLFAYASCTASPVKCNTKLRDYRWVAHLFSNQPPLRWWWQQIPHAMPCQSIPR